MAFEVLGEKLQRIIKNISGQGKLSEKNMDEMLKEIRISLLEADVNFKVVRKFIEEVKEKAIGKKVLTSVTPGDMITKILNDELISLLGEDNNKDYKNIFSVMLVGLQGSGKTTSCVKLAHYLEKKYNKKALLVGLDVYRPAAMDQLKDYASKHKIDTYINDKSKDVVSIAKEGLEYAKNNRYSLVIFDSAGRLEIDDALMNELKEVEKSIKLDEIFYVVDSLSGQEAVNVAVTFKEHINISGVIATKLDSDARGGSLLSIKYVSNLPILFSGIGEKVSDFELFHPSRIAGRILGKGDVVTLVEKAQEHIDENKAKKAVNKMMSGNFSLQDMLEQMEQVNKMGSLGGLMKFMPGMPKISKEDLNKAEKELKVTKAIINSMTLEERNDPSILKASRKIRIAKGSGTNPSDVNKVLNKYDQTKEMMKRMKTMFKGKNPFGGF